MKNIQTVLIFSFWVVCSVATAHSQSLSIFDVDTKDFPTVRAKVYAFDDGWKNLFKAAKSWIK